MTTSSRTVIINEKKLLTDKLDLAVHFQSAFKSYAKHKVLDSLDLNVLKGSM